MDTDLKTETMVTPAVETVKPWCSKTLWVSLLVAVAPFLPPVQAALIANPELAAGLVGAIFGALRLISSNKVKIK